jgi:DNA-binding transcriptional MerR regulator
LVIDDSIHRLPRMSMADAMRVFGLTARAIRYYEEKRLVTATRNRANSRHFDERARARLGWISVLRAAGLGLRDIAEVLAVEERQGRGQGCALVKLEARRAEVEEQLAGIDRAVMRLQRSESVFQPVRVAARA